MPLYTYIHPDTEETIDIVQSVHDEHVYIDQKGITWRRVFTAPEVNTQGNLRADCTPKEFSEFTRNKKVRLAICLTEARNFRKKEKKFTARIQLKKNIIRIGLKNAKAEYTQKVI